MLSRLSRPTQLANSPKLFAEFHVYELLKGLKSCPVKVMMNGSGWSSLRLLRQKMPVSQPVNNQCRGSAVLRAGNQKHSEEKTLQDCKHIHRLYTNRQTKQTELLSSSFNYNFSVQ